MPPTDSRIPALDFFTGTVNCAEGYAFLPSLTLVVQKLTGAQTAIFFQSSFVKSSPDYRIAATSPADWQPANPEILKNLALFGSQADGPVLWGNGAGPAQVEDLLTRHDLAPMVIVPLEVENRKLGQLMLLKLPDDRRTDLILDIFFQQSDLVALLFHQALLSIDHDQKMLAKVRGLFLKDRISHILLNSRNDHPFEEALGVLLEELQTPFAGFCHQDENGRMSNIKYYSRKPDSKIEAGEMSLLEQGLTRVMGTSKPFCHQFHAPDFKTDVPFPQANHLATPILHLGLVTGVLQLVGRPFPYGEQDLHLLTEIAGMMAPGLEKNRQERIRQEAEEILCRSEKKYKTLFTDAGDGILISDSSGRILEANQALAERLGFSMEELTRLSLADINLVPDIPDTAEYFQKVCAQGKLCFESSQRTKNGSHISVETIARLIDYNQQTAILCISRDITQRKEQEKSLRLAAAVFENTTEGVLITDAQRNIIAVNRAFSNITGYEAAEVLGRTPGFLRSRRHSRAFYKDMWLEIDEAGSWRGETWNRHKKGNLYPQWLNISTVRNETGQATHYVAVFMDISAVKEAEAELQHLAHHDSLTGLANRLLFKDRLEHAVAIEQRNKGRFAVLFIDLDRFKQVNDTFGHPTGDELLKLAARRLLTCVRQQDTVARLGGDEFAMLLEGLSHSKDSGQVAQNIIQSLTAPFHLHGHDIHVSASIGISIYPDDGPDSVTLLKNADSAMFRAKNRGRNTYRFYTPSLNSAAKSRYALETSLRKALERSELFLHYQPQLDLTHRKIVAVEALLRWQHTEKGLIPPNQFIPIAEESGMIVTIGGWVLSQACRQAMAWRRQGRDPLVISVNISAAQFHHHDFLATLDRILAQSGLPPQFLELEITESMIMSDIHAATAIMQKLRTRDVQLAIDDFGTGYSSLNYLKRFPIQKLKIDRSFIHGILADPADTAIVNTIIGLGKNLNLITVAEGVETEEQLQFLIDNHCDLGQGYLLGRPAEELP